VPFGGGVTLLKNRHGRHVCLHAIHLAAPVAKNQGLDVLAGRCGFTALLNRKGFPRKLRCDSRLWLEGGHDGCRSPIQKISERGLWRLVGADATYREAAKWFSIGVSSAVRWTQRFRQAGSVARPMDGNRHSSLKE
jgi:hypothetical protein